MKTQQTQSNPHELPVIGAEEATRLLTTPGLRITNRMRKACMAVRMTKAKPNWNKHHSGEARALCCTPKQVNFSKRAQRYTFKQLANLAKRIPVWHERTRRALVKTSKELPRQGLKQKLAILRFMAETVEANFNHRTGSTLHLLPQ